MSDSDLQITFGADASGVVQGANQAKSAVDDFGARIQGIAGAVGTLGDKLRGGLEGFQSLAKGLSAAGGEGAAAGAGLAALAQAGEAVIGVAVTIAQIAVEAGGAIAQWAEQTANSSTASAEAKANATALNSALSEAQGAFSQVGGILANALAPVMTQVVKDLKDMAEAFADNYKHGGEAKIAVDALVVGVKALVFSIDDVITTIAVLWDDWKSIWGGITGLVGTAVKAIGADAEALGAVFKDLGQVINAALSGNATAGAGALANLMKDVADAAKQLAAPFGDLGSGAAQGAASGAQERTDAVRAFRDRTNSPSQGGQSAGSHGGSGPSGRQGAHQSAGGASSPQTTAIGASDTCPVTACADQAKDGVQQVTDAKLKAIDDQTRDAQQGVANQLVATKSGIEQQIAAVKQAAAAGQISRNQELGQIEAIHGQETEAAKKAAQEQYQIAAEAVAKKAALGSQDIASVMQTISQETDLYMSYWSKVDQLSAEGNRRLATDNNTTLAQLTKDWNAAVSPIVSSFSRGMMQMAEGTKSLVQVMRGFGQQILDDWLKMVDKLVDKWLSGQLAQLMATQATTAQQVVLQAAGANQTMSIGGATALKDITNSAAQAAGKAYNALSGVPIVGPVLGAAAAAAVFGGVMAFKGLVSSAAGGFDIPAGLNPVTQLHAQEMVLPARLANPMRDMLAGFSSGGDRPSAAGGEVHNHTHNWSVTAMDGPSVEKFLRTHGDRMVKVLNERARANAGVALGYAR